MAWVKVDDKFARGFKVKRAAGQLGGKKARGRVLAVWLDAMSYCNLQLTDGFVPDIEVEDLPDADAEAVLQAMTVGEDAEGKRPIIDRVAGGWQFRNYEQYQKTKAEVEHDRAKDRGRKRKPGIPSADQVGPDDHPLYREVESAGFPDGIHSENHRTPDQASTDSSNTVPTRPVPARTDQDRTDPAQTDTAACERVPDDIAAILAKEPFDRSQDENERLAAYRGITLLPRGTRPSRARTGISADLPQHRGHFGSGVLPSCARGICVPDFLAQTWKRQLDGDPSVTDPDEYLRRFIADTLRPIPPGPIGEDALKFWRKAWEQRHGAAIAGARPMQKADITREAARNILGDSKPQPEPREERFAIGDRRR